jgi:hypothetical protein
MRNTGIVREFKKVLVRAFYELRAQVEEGYRHLAPAQPTSVAHRADHTVAAQRAFSALFRAGRTMGIPRPQAIRAANEAAARATGVDLVQELEADSLLREEERQLARRGDISTFTAAWMAGKLPIPYAPCLSQELADAYHLWAREQGIHHPAPAEMLQAHIAQQPGMRKDRAWMMEAGRRTLRSALFPPFAKRPDGMSQTAWVTREVERFREALRSWVHEVATGQRSG